MARQSLKKFFQQINFEVRQLSIRDSDSNKQIARFYDGIAADYDQIFGIHAEVVESDLKALLASIGRQHFNRVLEIGCGPGVLTGRLLSVVDYCLAIDIATEMVEIAQRNLASFDKRSWSAEEADILNLPARIKGQKFDAVFFWGNGMTHIPPQQYAQFASSVNEILDQNGLLIINMRDGKEWIKLAGKLDLLSKTEKGANFVHIYTPKKPQVGDMFECVIVSVECSRDHEISGQIVSSPIQAYFNDNAALLQHLSENGLELIRDLPSSGLSTARTVVFQGSL